MGDPLTRKESLEAVPLSTLGTACSPSAANRGRGATVPNATARGWWDLAVPHPTARSDQPAQEPLPSRLP